MAFVVSEKGRSKKNICSNEIIFIFKTHDRKEKVKMVVISDGVFRKKKKK